jgi:uncharacterized protein with HEPN domain
MNRSDLDRLRDARDFARDAQGHAVGLSADVLAEAWQPQHAALYALVVVGEALAKIPTDIRSAAPAIQWNAITALRNHLVHAYWQIDLEIIADVIENRIDPLVAELAKLIVFVERMDA